MYVYCIHMHGTAYICIYMYCIYVSSFFYFVGSERPWLGQDGGERCGRAHSRGLRARQRARMKILDQA